MQRSIAELTGSFFLTLSVGLSGDPLSVGLVASAVIMTGVPVSGAHFNPAVTLAFWSAGSCTLRDLGGYLFWQIVGGIAGALLVRFLGGASFRLLPAAAAEPVQYAVIELLFGFLLCLVYLMLFLHPGYREWRAAGLIIGIAYAGILMVGYPLSGGVFNPAIATGIALVDAFDYGNSWRHLPVWIFAPCVGALTAALIFRFFHSQTACNRIHDSDRKTQDESSRTL